jgi:Flp pilus assembly protein TadD/SAM-dependent methyltransferase
MPSNVEQIFTQALTLHQRGQLGRAEDLYRQVLAASPHNLDALNLLGVLALQGGRNEEAIDLISRALAGNDRIADFHNNIAEAYRRSGRLDAAAAHFAKAAELEPTLIAAHQNLAATLKAQGKWDLVATRYRRLLAIQPNLAEGHSGLADALLRQGQFAEADGHYRRALTLKPDRPEVHNNFGIALKAQGRVQEAAVAFGRAATLKPDFADAHRNLATALLEQGEFGRALEAAARAVQLTASVGDKILFVRCAWTAPPSVADADGTIRASLQRAWSELWGRPSDLARLSIVLIKRNPAVVAAIARSKAPAQRLTPEELWGSNGLAAPARDRLFRYLMETATVGDADLERVLTATRRIVLGLAASAAANAVTGEELAFCCALARQCFINEYVFAQADEELEQARRLRDALTAALQSDGSVPPIWAAVVAAYWPLHELPAADVLIQRTWPEPLAGLLKQQIGEPREEMRSRPDIARLTAVDDAVSLQVQQQYEENPYPRWVDIGRIAQPTTLQAWMSELCRDAAPSKHAGGDILIAGCGTGQQAIETAQTFPDARVLAVDLSLASLAYAQRKTRELGLTNLDYAQADIMRLGSIGRTFDLVEAVGVLHHLADPLAGWRVLTKLMRPHGVMHVGLYSEAARRHIVAARDFIARRGYQASAHDIRRCRQDLLALEKAPGRMDVTESGDFFSISACRDLLFHVAERRMKLPEIEAFLGAEGLAVVGLQVETSMAARYRSRFPDDPAMTDLAHWHAFEMEHPYMFAGMYLFWVRHRNR